MKPEKMKSLSETKLRHGFAKNVKFHFCHVICAVLRFYLSDLCMKMMWVQCDFFLVIFITLFFQIKKSHTCEEGGAHLKISFWHLLMNMKNKLSLQKNLKWANKKKIISIFTMLHF